MNIYLHHSRGVLILITRNNDLYSAAAQRSHNKALAAPFFGRFAQIAASLTLSGNFANACTLGEIKECYSIDPS